MRIFFAPLEHVKERLSVGRLHTEWRIMLFTLCFAAAAAVSVSLWKNIDIVEKLFVASLSLFLLFFGYGLGKKQWQSFWLALLLFSLFGFVVGQFRVLYVVDDYMLNRPYAHIEGRVKRIDYRSNRPDRLYVIPRKIGAMTSKLPALLRVSSRTKIEEGVRAGDSVTFTAKISPVHGAIVPGGYNFARAAFFRGIGADAIALSPIRRLPGAGDVRTMADTITGVREAIERYILGQLNGQAGAVAVALTVGYRNHLSQETIDTLRRAGLSHLLAISGLHMGLIAAVSFFVFEALFASFPALAYRIMPRKLAILPTWCVAIFYLMISGASTSTLRAFIMVSVALLAIAFDRKVLSIRSVALAALFILLIWPESILSAGFQLSFAATTGLIIFYEFFTAWQVKNEWGRFRRGPVKFLWYVIAIGITSLVAQISVAPFVLFHFQTLSIVGVIANILALPIITFLTMPLLFLTLCLMPFGGIGLVADSLSWTLELVLKTASWTAHLPYAEIHTAPLADGALIFLCFGLAVALISRENKVILAGFGIVVAAFLFGQKETVAILISESGSIIAEKRDGMLLTVGGRATSFRDKAWRQYWGFNPDTPAKPLLHSCSATACGYDILGTGDYRLTKTKTLGAVRQACSRGNIVILPQKYTRYCHGALAQISLEILEKKGPLGLQFTSDTNVSLHWSQK